MKVGEARRALVDPTAQLVGFVRELGRTGQRHIADVADYELVRWLIDLRSAEVDIDLVPDGWGTQ